MTTPRGQASASAAELPVPGGEEPSGWDIPPMDTTTGVSRVPGPFPRTTTSQRVIDSLMGICKLQPPEPWDPRGKMTLEMFAKN